MSQRWYLSEELALEPLEEKLARDGFRESLWDELADALARYGLRVIGSWTATGEIFTIMFRQQIRYKRPDSDGRRPSHEDAAELANETVARGLAKLRGILAAQGWSLDGGARLRTFFISQCLFQFPNVYRRWWRETRPFDLAVDDELAELPDAVDRPDTASQVLAQRHAVEVMRAMPNDTLRFAFQMRAEGYTVTEVAATLGLRPKQLENMLGRFRRGPRGRGLSWTVD